MLGQTNNVIINSGAKAQTTDSRHPLSSLAFEKKEKVMKTGLKRYLAQNIGEYLTDEQMESFVGLLETVRKRPVTEPFSEKYCRCISESSELRNRFIPAKTMRKDELSILFYNLAPYALLSRREASIMAKCAFPNFFASPATINSTFTKYLLASMTCTGKKITLAITNIADHSPEYLEWLLINLGRSPDQ